MAPPVPLRTQFLDQVAEEDPGVVISPSGRRIDAAAIAERLDAAESRHQQLYQLFTTKQFDACSEILGDAASASDDHNQSDYTLYVKALVKTRETRPQDALDLLQRILDRSAASGAAPSNALQVYKLMARNLIMLGRHKSALAVLDEALTVGGPEWEILHHCGLCYMLLKDNEKAVQSFSEALKLQRHESTFVQLGHLLIQMEQYASAEHLFTTALKISPRNGEFALCLGLLAMLKGDLGEATNWLGHTMMLDETSHQAVQSFTAIVQSELDYDAALIKHRISAVQAPNSALLWNNIGMCFMGKDNNMAATACLKRAQYLAPFDWSIQFNLGLVHLRGGQHASAFHFLKAASNLNPRSSEAFGWLGVTLAYLDDEDNAFSAFERALQLDRNNVTARTNYASILRHYGRGAEADKQMAALAELEGQLQNNSVANAE